MQNLFENQLKQNNYHILLVAFINALPDEGVSINLVEITIERNALFAHFFAHFERIKKI